MVFFELLKFNDGSVHNRITYRKLKLPFSLFKNFSNGVKRGLIKISAKWIRIMYNIYI